ncbi:Bug family tripartite tricarboxylate transporter substrate binding protein [Thermodesulfobacteriota bacterium]
MKKGIFIAFLGCGLITIALQWHPLAPAYGAEAFPSKPIRWIVPYSPGGGFDVYSRAVARFLPKHLPNKAQVVIVNVTGAGGTVGVSKVYHSKPDGHTLGIMNTAGVASASALGNIGLKLAALKFDVLELTYLGVITQNIYSLCVGRNSPYKTLKELQSAKGVKFPTTGVGSSEWSHTVLTTNALGINVRHVTGYTGSTPARLSVVAGDTHAIMATVASAWAQIQAGDLIPIFYIQDVKKYFPEAPNVPTATQLGHPELIKFAGFWRHIIAPPGVPENRVKILEKALWSVIQDPEFRAWSKKARRPIILPTKAQESKEIVAGLIETLKGRLDVFKAALSH